MRLSRTVTCWLAASFAGCANLADFPASTDGGLAPDTQVSCTGGSTRCQGQSYLWCTDGAFREVLRCDPSRTCVPGMGCVDCDPSVGRTCVNNKVFACSKDGRLGAALEDCMGQTCAAGTCTDGPCAWGAKTIYVVDDQHRLLRFDPSKEGDPFELIATLKCPTQLPALSGGPATPFSMSIDRSARAWVLYGSGELFWVDTKTGACTATPYVVPAAQFRLFGMGFVSDAPGSSKEKLYVASSTESTPAGELGVIVASSMKLSVIGPIPDYEHSPELTGTGNAELYAYYPGQTASYVARLDKATGTLTEKWPVIPTDGQVRAWAFAHWGGKFYIFVTTVSEDDYYDQRSRVVRLDPQTGRSEVLFPSTPYAIVGAGVSTCAPVIE